MRQLLILAVCALLCISSGCYALSAPAGLAPATVPCGVEDYTEVGTAEGTSWGFSLFGLTLSEPNQMKSARDEAIQESNSDALINVSSSLREYYFLMYFVFRKTIVRGIGVKFHDDENEEEGS